MKDVKKKVYNNVYGRKEVSHECPRGAVAFLYRKLSRCEVTRYARAKSLHFSQPSRGRAHIELKIAIMMD